ncbi:MAG TPA: restriction endonuclease subunit S [Candidatus Dormibacteraeota bacterium]|nr:restriction endonuclease subunit S [Candidatus Dormibacteraeota bacterium]
MNNDVTERPRESQKSTWSTVEVGDLGEFVNGYPFMPDEWTVSQGDPIIRIQNLTDPAKPFNYFAGTVATRYRVHDGDLLISWSASLDAFIWNGPDAWLNQHIFKVTPNTDVVDPDFLYFLMRREIRNIALSARGSTMKHVTGKIFRQHKVSIPTLDEQRRIARILSTVRLTQACVYRSTRILADLRKSVAARLFAPSDKCQTVRLGDVITLQRGHDLPSQDRVFGPVPVVSSSGITGWHTSSKADGPGVVIGRYGTLGVVHFVQGPYWPLNTTLYVKDFHGNDPRFVGYFLETLSYEMHNDKTSVPGVNRNDLHALQIDWPQLADQRRIAKTLDAVERRLTAERGVGSALDSVFSAAVSKLLAAET